MSLLFYINFPSIALRTRTKLIDVYFSCQRLIARLLNPKFKIHNFGLLLITILLSIN